MLWSLKLTHVMGWVVLRFGHIYGFENEGVKSWGRGNPGWTLVPVPEPTMVGWGIGAPEFLSLEQRMLVIDEYLPRSRSHPQSL